MTSLPDLYQMPSEQLRTLAAQLMSKVDTQRRKIPSDETIIEQLTHEIAIATTIPRTAIHHEPDNTQCACGCKAQRIGEDVSEKLDYRIKT